MKKTTLAFQNVSFTYETGLIPIVKTLTRQFSAGWTGVVGENGAGKSTLLKLATGTLQPTDGCIIKHGLSLYCQQRMDFIPDEFLNFVESDDNEAWRIKSTLEIGLDWPYRWETLSYGERKRAQIGTMLWMRPEILAVDEPTNHLDYAASQQVADALESYRGVGLLVSHDRDLLDRLCSRCLFFQSGEVIFQNGNYSEGSKQIQVKQEHDQAQLEKLNHEEKKLKRLEAKHRDEASKAHKKRSKKGIAIKDHDAKFKKNRARVTGKDGTAGKLMNQLQGRIRQTREKISEISITRAYETGVWIEGCFSGRNTLFSIPAGKIPLGDGRYLNHPKLVMKPTDRIAFTGKNGTGKSTLIRHILDHINVDHDRLIYLAQEISQKESRRIMSQVQEMNNEDKGLLMTIVSRLGSRPERVLSSELPSPGEVRKCLLALGMTRRPHLIIMDEPTNHLDLPSIECLEEALMACPCGLLLISHDQQFLSQLTEITWSIENSNLVVD